MHVRRGVAGIVGVAALALSAAVPIAVSSTQASAAVAHSTAMCGRVASPPKYKHVIVIMEENHSYGAIVKSSAAKYLNSVMKACGLATNYHSITHLSLPNYLGITSGTPLGQLQPYTGDCAPYSCSRFLGSNNLFNQVSTKGGWSAFAESMPGKCARSDHGNYAVRHNPPVYFTDLIRSCSTHDVSLGSTTKSPLLRAFAKQATAPAVSFVTPNLCSDMHNCSVSTGDAWMKRWLPLITKTPVYRSNNTAIFILWDEGEPGYTGENCVSSSDQSCHVAAIVVAPSVRPGTSVHTSFSHYSVLKTIEDLLGVPELGAAATASSMASGFNL